MPPASSTAPTICIWVKESSPPVGGSCLTPEGAAATGIAGLTAAGTAAGNGSGAGRAAGTAAGAAARGAGAAAAAWLIDWLALEVSVGLMLIELPVTFTSGQKKLSRSNLGKKTSSSRSNLGKKKKSSSRSNLGKPKKSTRPSTGPKKLGKTNLGKKNKSSSRSCLRKKPEKPGKKSSHSSNALIGVIKGHSPSPIRTPCSLTTLPVLTVC